MPPEPGRAEIDFVSMVGEMAGRTTASVQEVVGGVEHTKYEGYYALPLYATRSVTVGHLRALFAGDVPTANPIILWQVVAEDGIFPGPEEYGKIELV